MIGMRSPAPVVHAHAQSACVLHALGCVHIVRPALGAADGLLLFRETPTERGPLVELFSSDAHDPPGDPAASGCVPLLLGHQQAPEAPRSCPVCADDGCDLPSSLRLAAVAVAVDPDGRVLITRRTASMSTFPGCWVLPGGAVDASDSSLAAAALRELREETGVEAVAPPAASAPPLCVWESCYPTTDLGWADARRAGGRTAHHLVAFIEVRVAANALVTLQGDECDAAAWVHPSAICADGGAADVDIHWSVTDGEMTAHGMDVRSVGAASLHGIYPNVLGEGIGRGHRWAIEQLFASRSQGPTSIESA